MERGIEQNDKIAMSCNQNCNNKKKKEKDIQFDIRLYQCVGG